MKTEQIKHLAPINDTKAAKSLGQLPGAPTAIKIVEQGEWIGVMNTKPTEIYKDPIYKQSEKIVPFCPKCGIELDRVDMLNTFSSCRCGEWWESGMGGKTTFKPYPPKKTYTLYVNGEEQP